MVMENESTGGNKCFLYVRHLTTSASIKEWELTAEESTTEKIWGVHRKLSVAQRNFAQVNNVKDPTTIKESDLAAAGGQSVEDSLCCHFST